MRLKHSCPTCEELNIERSLLNEPLYVCGNYLRRIVAAICRGKSSGSIEECMEGRNILPCHGMAPKQLGVLVDEISGIQSARVWYVPDHTTPIEKLKINVTSQMRAEGIPLKMPIVFKDTVKVRAGYSITINLSWFLESRRRKLVYNKQGEYVLGLHNGVVYALDSSGHLAKRLFSSV